MFGKAGEIMEVRMMMDAKTGKNKGFCFLRYKEPAQAKKAVTELSKVEVFFLFYAITYLLTVSAELFRCENKNYSAGSVLG